MAKETKIQQLLAKHTKQVKKFTKLCKKLSSLKEKIGSINAAIEDLENAKIENSLANTELLRIKSSLQTMGYDVDVKA